MEAVAHNPSFAKKVGVPQSVGQDFSNADKGKTFKRGGDMASKMNPGFMAMMARKKGAAPSAMGKPTMKKGMDMAKDGMKKMASGGMPMKDGKPAFIGDGKGAMKHGGMTKKMATGGSASKRADGVATKGKTQGKMLKKGGMAC
jgi:hypothetical protein